MIISVIELRKFITTDQSDEVLEARLQALELLIRKYTNNNFQNKNIRFKCNASSNGLDFSSEYLSVSDTIQISQSQFNDGLYVVKSNSDGSIALDKTLYDEQDVLVTKIEYPFDVQMGVTNMIKWDIENRDKVGIQSESISRHSVTYFNMDGDNSLMGYPKSLLGFLEPYRKARF